MNFDDKDEILVVSTGGGTGYNNAILVGIREATAGFVAFQDSDDISHPQRLKKEIDALIDMDADIAYCKMQSINSKDMKLFHYLRNVREPDFLGYCLLLGSYGANSTWVIRDTALKMVDFKRAEQSFDWAIAMKDLVGLQIVYCHEPLYFYRKHEGQMTRDHKYINKSLSEIYQIWSVLNKKMGLPHLGYPDFDALVNPWKRSDLSSKAIEWLEYFDTEIKKQETSNLLFYKIIYLRIFTKAKNKTKLKMLRSFRRILLEASLYILLSLVGHIFTKERKIHV
jgi:glycosyltransferase involved in cell wall biosynthesis